MDNPRFSVVIPTSDRPEFLQRAIRSSLAQSMSVEVIVVDDSSVRYSNFNESVVSQFDRVRYIRETIKMGVSAARNIGAHYARSDKIVFLDDDDWWLSGYLTAVSCQFQRAHADLVLSSFLEENNGILVPEKVPRRELFPSDFLIRNPGLRGSNIAISKELFMEMGGFDESLTSMNDLDFGFRVFSKSGVNYSRIAKPFVVFNQHGGNRLSTPGSMNKHNGVREFYLKHYTVFSHDQHIKYLERAQRFWRVDIGTANKKTLRQVTG